MDSILTPKRVEEIFEACLYKDEYATDGLTHQLISIKGVVLSVYFDYLPLAKHMLEIENMLRELPDEFKKFSGGGWSFLEACNDKHGNQWTGIHQTMDKLFMLGMGIDKVEYLLPREQWGNFPGGMPYLVITSYS
jgi:hypothetical protein